MEWRSVGPSHEVSSEGEVRNIKTGHVLSATIGSNGRYHVGIRTYAKSQIHTAYVHVLVCEAFNGPRPEKHVASHIDGDMLNNRADNLVWETQKENLARRNQHGTSDRGFNNTRAVLTEEKVHGIFALRLAGKTHQEIAQIFSVSRPTISRVLNKQRYTEVGNAV